MNCLIFNPHCERIEEWGDLYLDFQDIRSKVEKAQKASLFMQIVEQVIIRDVRSRKLAGKTAAQIEQPSNIILNCN
jgi:hypothetical protein